MNTARNIFVSFWVAAASLSAGDVQFDPKDVRPAQLAAAALAEAREWKADAYPVDLYIATWPDGVINLERADTVLMFQFVSPDAKEGGRVIAQKDGTLKFHPNSAMENNGLQFALPTALPGKWVDFAEAFAAARKQAPAGPAGDKIAVYLRKYGPHGGHGWEIQFPSGQPGLPHQVFVDGLSGKLTTANDLTGFNEHVHRLEQFEAGKKLAGRPDFSALRREADAWAQQVDPDNMLFRVDLFGSYAGGRLDGILRFHYRAPAETTSWRIVVQFDGDQLTGAYDVHGSPEDIQPVPGNILAAEEAFARLAALDPNLPPENMLVQLLRPGVEKESALPIEYRTAGVGVDHALPEENKWVWRMFARRPGALISTGKVTADYHLKFIYTDAVSGDTDPRQAATASQSEVAAGVQRKLRAALGTDGDGISVEELADGSLRLTGRVPTAVVRARAEQMSARVDSPRFPGKFEVRKVVNELEVGAAAPPGTGSTPGSTPDTKTPMVAPAVAKVDPAFVGTWELQLNSGETVLTAAISADGAYMLTTRDSLGASDRRGTFEAADGNWTLKWPEVAPTVGFYRFDGADSVTITAAGQTNVWVRAATVSGALLSGDSAALYARAWKEQQAGNHREAVALYDQVIAKSPTLAWAWCNRAACRIALREHDAAQTDCTEAIRIDPTLSRAFMNRGLAHGGLRNAEEAMQDFGKAIDLEPSDIYPWCYRGRLRMDLRQPQAGLDDLWQAQEIDKKGAAALIADVYNVFTRQLEADPSGAESYCWRGALHDLLGKYDDALADLNRALQLNPESAEAYCRRGITHFHRGDNAAAARDYEQALHIDKRHAGAYMSRAMIQIDRDARVKDLTWAIQCDPTLARAYYLRGLTYHTKFAGGMGGSAMEDYDEAVRLNPHFAWAYTQRGVLNVEIGMTFENTVAGPVITGFNPENLRLGIADYNRSLRIEPRHAMSYANRGFALMKLGQNREAVADLAAAYRLEPSLGPQLDAEIEKQRSFLEWLRTEMPKVLAERRDMARAMADHDRTYEKQRAEDRARDLEQRGDLDGARLVRERAPK